ncbi:MAG TPA: hypothetical protein VMA36_20530 [Candidatus Limnocylindria bacterium]|nr:hypothetical protein [Candidatus Limnocylindria bacterium]
MLALAPSRGWNYQVTSGSTSLTVSLYSDPDLVNGINVLAGTAVTGLVPTVLTSSTAAESAAFGGLGLTKSSSGYNATAEVSVGSTAAIPGNPLFVASTLTQGTTTSPYPGATEVVTFVGNVPNANVCPTPATGATVSYTYPGQGTTIISYVPGCGITQVVDPSNEKFNLVSVGTYSSIGDLSTARRVQSATLADTARSLLGLERSDFPAAHLLSSFLRRP